jgi:competence protein ComEC
MAGVPRYVSAIRLGCLLLALRATADAAKTLDIYFIDVEGGQSTLVVSPSGQSLLIDVGYIGYGGRDADRIAAAAKAAGVKKIDYLFITHFHDDHIGGIANLVERLPVANFLDHGVSIETGMYPERYETAFAKGQHTVYQAGDKIPIKGLETTVVAAAGKSVTSAGEANPHCAGVDRHPEGGTEESGENTHSGALVIQFGKFRFADLGDLTYNKQRELLCPQNRVGKVDLYLAAHHGGETSQAVWGVAPRATVINNGPRKGGDPAAWKILSASPGLGDLWQLHFAVAGGKETNAPDTLIANVDESGPGLYLKVSANADGSFTVFNQRNKYTKSYATGK